MDWSQPWAIGSGVSLLLFLLSALLRLTGKPGVLALLARFLKWCAGRAATEIRLLECQSMCQAYEEALGYRRAAEDIRRHSLLAGVASKFGSGERPEMSSPTLQTTPRSLLPLDQSERER